MKFYGIKKNASGDVKANCILMIRISTPSESDVFLCYDTVKNEIIVYKGNTILFEDSSFNDLNGKWVLISFTNYHSNMLGVETTSFYPMMFSFAYNGLTIPKASTYNIDEPGIKVNTLIFGYQISATITDVRIYHSFILNPYGIITNDESYQKHLIYQLELFGSSTSCVSSGSLKDESGNDISSYFPCYPDYNIYHDLTHFNCHNNPDKMIDFFSDDKECQDCIDECTYCGGDDKFNCACYYNDLYWFRYDKENYKQLYCQRVPYHDFNKYSEVQFNDVQYATTNEYAIEFWYFIYSYNKNNILFKQQSIQWTNHVKIEISKKDNKNVYVDCYPLSNQRDSIKERDESQGYFKWYHIVCGTTIKKKLYYLNERPYVKLSDSDVSGIDYSSYGNTKTTLLLKNDLITPTSHGAILIKELRLWELYSMREFPTECTYNAEYMKTGRIPFLLHYYPFRVPKSGIITDSKENQPNILIKKANIIGYNIVAFTDVYSEIDNEFDECLITFTIPSIGYFNLTYFLIENKKLKEPETEPTYTFTYYISEDAKLTYDDITTKPLPVSDDQNGNPVPNEALLEKLTDDEFKDADINVYVTETDPDDPSNPKVGFGRIAVIEYAKGRDIDLEKYTIGIDDYLNVDPDNLDDKVKLTPSQLWNRLQVIVSLGEINNAARANINMTDTEIDYNEHDNQVDPYNLTTENPLCTEASCSYQGNCYIVVRATSCSCFNGYTGMNCHLTVDNKEFLDQLFIKYWDYFTNNHVYTTLDNNYDITNTFVEQIMFLVKGATVFSVSSDIIFSYFYNFIDYLESTKISALSENYISVLRAFDYLSITLYENINANRRENYISSEAETTYDDIEREDNIIKGINGENRNLASMDTEGGEEESDDNKEQISTNYTQTWINATSLTDEQLTSFYQYSSKLIEYIEKIVLLGIKAKKPDLYMHLQAIDVTIKPTTVTFNYTSYFNEKIAEDREKRFFYRSFVDSSKCSSLIFNANNQLFLVVIQFRYSPLSFHSIYSTSASFLNDIFYATSDGEKVDISECPNEMSIYFPFNLYNKTKTQFMASHAAFLSQHINIGPKHPYVSWPHYVYKNGTVSHKDRQTRINEVKPLMDINCTSYSNDLRISERRLDITIEENFYVSCPTNHYSLFSLEAEHVDRKYKLTHIFFYLEAPQVFKCSENWSNSCFIVFIILIAFVLLGILITLIYDYFKVLRTKNLLDNVKVEILRENLMYYDGRTLEEDLNFVNRIYKQDQMEKDLKLDDAQKGATPNNNNSEIPSIDINSIKNSEYSQTESQNNSDSNYITESINDENDSNENSNSNSANPPKRHDSETSEEVNTSANFGQQDPASTKKLTMKDKKKSMNDEETDNPQTDFFSRFANTKNSKYDDKLAGKITVVKELDTRIDIPDIFEDIERNNLSFFRFFIWCEIRRNVYISPFTLKSAINPKWKRIFCIYVYLLLQYFWNVIFLTFVERSGMSMTFKMFTMHIPQIFLASICFYPIIWFFRVDTPTKILLLKTLRSSEQMKLIYEWKQMKKRQRRKLIFGLIVSGIIWFISFYFSFNYCSVMYLSRKTYILTFITGILMDLIVYEGLTNLFLSILYSSKGVHVGNAFKKYFNIRSYRNCM